MIELRPHHILCIRFFEGKGYNSEFTEHMRNTIEKLQEKDSQIVLAEKEDEICKKCPNISRGTCKSREKVYKYDKAVIKETALSPGTPVEYEKLQRIIQEKILDTGKIHDICADCSWAYICHK